jgi:DNA-binding IclR family transcriptional regulator
MDKANTMEEKGVATLDRALAILAAFTEEAPRLSLAEMSRRTGLYKSTLLRLMSSLQQSGLIEQQDDGNYHVGATAMRLANLYQRSLRGSDVIGTALQKLVEASAENANFYVRRGDARVCVYCADSPQRIRAHTLVGDIFPLDRGAGGKILSAFSDDLRSAPGLAAVRERCIAVSHGEFASDLSGIAAPVLGIGNRIEGAVSVTGPTGRFTAERLASFEGALLATAVELTRAFGGDTKDLEAALYRAQQKPPAARRATAVHRSR